MLKGGEWSRKIWVVDEYMDKATKRDRHEVFAELRVMRPGAKPPWMFETREGAEKFMVMRARRRMEEAKHEWQRSRQRLWKLEKKIGLRVGGAGGVGAVEKVPVEEMGGSVESSPVENVSVEKSDE